MELEAQNITDSSAVETTVTENTPIEIQQVDTKQVSSVDELKAKAKTLSDDQDTKLSSQKPDVSTTKFRKSKSTNETVEKTEPVDAIPQYSPDFKYKANGQVKELDPRLKAVIKTKEDEEYFKKVFEKADGIEEIKGHRDHIRNQYNTLAGQASQVIQYADKGDYKSMMGILGVKTEDIGKVMTGLGYDKESIIKYAYHLAQLTPEQEQAYAKEKEHELYQQQQQSQFDQLNQKLYQADVKLKSSELQQVLSTPEYAHVVNAFDQHHGQGAFWNAVCEKGEYYYMKNVDKSVLDIVDEVGRIARLYSQPQQTQMQQQVNQAIPATNTHVNKSIPVIPNVSGGSSSPARRKVTNLKDLKAFAKTLND